MATQQPPLPALFPPDCSLWADLISGAILGKCSAKNTWDILSSAMCFCTTLSVSYWNVTFSKYVASSWLIIKTLHFNQNCHGKTFLGYNSMVKMNLQVSLILEKWTNVYFVVLIFSLLHFTSFGLSHNPRKCLWKDPQSWRCRHCHHTEGTWADLL